MAAAERTTKLTDKDLLRVADVIPVHEVTKIAVNYLEFQKNQVDQSWVNHGTKPNPVLEHKLNLLQMWRNKKGREGTRENLHKILSQASKSSGLIQRTDLGFLLQPPKDESEHAGKPNQPPPMLRPLHQESVKKDAKPAPPTKELKAMTVPLVLSKETTEYQRSKSDDVTRGSLTVAESPECHNGAAAAAAAPNTERLGQVDQKLYGGDTTLLGGTEEVAIYQTKEVSMKHRVTIQTELAVWSGTRFCRLADGNTVIFGKKAADTSDRGPGIYIYSSEGTKKKRLEDVCEHKETKQGQLMAIKIDSFEFVLIACEHCKKMFLLNIENGKYYLSYENMNVALGPFCKGDENEMFVVARDEKRPTLDIFVLDTSIKRFSRNKEFGTEIKNAVSSVGYLPSTKCLLLFEKQAHKISVVSSATGKTQFQLNHKIFGLPFEPSCLAIYTKAHKKGSFDSVLVSDKSARLLVFSSRDGEFKHELKHNKFKDIERIQCVENILVVLQSRSNCVAVCIAEMNFEFESSV